MTATWTIYCQDCEESRILPYLQANVLSYHNFMMLAGDMRLLGQRQMTISHEDSSVCIGTSSLSLSSHNIIQQQQQKLFKNCKY